MAGLQHFKVAMDPAYVRYNNMMQNRYKYFRWNRRTGTVTFMFAVVVPAIVGYIGYTTDGLYDMRAKRRGDTIYER